MKDEQISLCQHLRPKHRCPSSSSPASSRAERLQGTHPSSSRGPSFPEPVRSPRRARRSHHHLTRTQARSGSPSPRSPPSPWQSCSRPIGSIFLRNRLWTHLTLPDSSARRPPMTMQHPPNKPSHTRMLSSSFSCSSRH